MDEWLVIVSDFCSYNVCSAVLALELLALIDGHSIAATVASSVLRG
jgi:hypothetical protein